MGACCSAPAGARGGEAVSRGVGGSDGADPHTAAPARSEAGSAAAAAALPRPSLGSTSAGYYSPPEGSSEDEGDVWHDALSDLEGVDALAEALEEWEEQQRFHEPGVDAAIRVGGAVGRRVQWTHGARVQATSAAKAPATSRTLATLRYRRC